MTQAVMSGRGAPAILLKANVYRAAWREFGLRPAEVDEMPADTVLWWLDVLSTQDKVQALKDRQEARAHRRASGRGAVGSR